VPGPHFDPGLAGSELRSTGDVVSIAPELARLTMNIAAAHHDSRVGRLLPNLVTGLGWESCGHTGPVHEGDTLYSELHTESPEPTDDGGVLGLRSLVYAVSDTAGEPDRPVLDWRFSDLRF
jgi:acyl dehydratase